MSTCTCQSIFSLCAVWMAISMFSDCRTNSSLLQGLSKNFPSHGSFQMRDLARRASSAAPGSQTRTPPAARSASTTSGAAALPSTNTKKSSTPTSLW